MLAETALSETVISGNCISQLDRNNVFYVQLSMTSFFSRELVNAFDRNWLVPGISLQPLFVHFVYVSRLCT